ncbi:MAG: hypothetical protein WC683_14865 [bacterium]
MGAKAAVVTLAILGTLVGGGYWWVSQPMPVVPPTHEVIILDHSDSMLEDTEQRLFRGLVEAALAIPNARKGSKVFVMSTGNQSTAMEPMPITSFEIPMTNRVMEGRDALDESRRELLARVVGEYRKGAVETKVSPIFLSVKRGLDQLHANGCVPGGRCQCRIRSDADETQETWLREAIRSGKIPKGPLPVRLDNRGIRVVWCGLSETRGMVVTKKGRLSLTGKRNGASTEHLQLVWRQIFTDPDNVSFAPFCPCSAEQH